MPEQYLYLTTVGRRTGRPHTIEIWFAELDAREVANPAEDVAARQAMAAKYRGWEPGEPLDEWAGGALVVALDRPANRPSA